MAETHGETTGGAEGTGGAGAPGPVGVGPGADLVVGADGRPRCGWARSDPLYEAYHDDEWGRPLRDERALFELMILEAFQSGLSWLLILRKRPGFREAFDGFDPEVIAGYGPDDVERLMADARIVRNRAKVEATVANARALADLHDAGQTLVDAVWAHAPEVRVPDPRPHTFAGMPSKTEASIALAKDLRKRGFRFVGPVVAYSLMQSAGLVDDHLEGCWVTSG